MHMHYNDTMINPAEKIIKQIEKQGYEVSGYHDVLDSEKGPVVINATHLDSGETFTVKAAHGDEYHAACELARLIGIDPMPQS